MCRIYADDAAVRMQTQDRTGVRPSVSWSMSHSSEGKGKVLSVIIEPHVMKT
jgi:hypothetical protein